MASCTRGRYRQNFSTFLAANDYKHGERTPPKSAIRRRHQHRKGPELDRDMAGTFSASLPSLPSLLSLLSLPSSASVVSLEFLDSLAHAVPKHSDNMANRDRKYLRFTVIFIFRRVMVESGVWHLNQAATRSTSVTSTPSLNFTPVITLVK
jgi:hypothetical protein